MRDPDVGFWTLVVRGLRRRCVRCGNGPSFVTWARMAESCPSCGFAFEREPGFWVGAMIINTVVASTVLMMVFVGGWITFWPDVPWTGLSIATLAAAVIAPVGFYPWSKSIWSAVELSYHPLDPVEREAAAGRAQVANQP